MFYIILFTIKYFQTSYNFPLAIKSIWQFSFLEKFLYNFISFLNHSK